MEVFVTLSEGYYHKEFFLASFDVKPTANDVTLAKRRSNAYRSNRKIMTIIS